MESELITVRRITLQAHEVQEAVRLYIQTYHDPPLEETDDYTMTFHHDGNAMVEVRHKAVITTEPDADPTEAIDPAKMMESLEKGFDPLQLEGD